MGIVERLASDTSLWVAMSTILCVGFIAWKAHRPIVAALDNRATLIQSRLQEAEQLHQEAKIILEEYKEKSQNASKEAEQILKNAQARADKLRLEMEAELSQTIARQEASVKLRIARIEAEAVETVKQAIIQAALDKVRQDIGKKQSDNDNVQQSLDRVVKTLISQV